MTVTKRFDKELFEQNDKLIKDKVLELFSNTNLELRPGKNRYSVDFEVFKEGHHFINCEVERKKLWTGPNFPYQNIQFPSRKKKFTELDKKTIFFMFNKECSHYLTVQSDDLAASPLVMVRNKYVPVGEYFFQVDVSKAKFNTLELITNS